MFFLFFFFFNDTATTEIYTLSLHDALPISRRVRPSPPASSRHLQACRVQDQFGLRRRGGHSCDVLLQRSEEHTSELQSLRHLVCRLLLEKKKKKKKKQTLMHNVQCTII